MIRYKKFQFGWVIVITFLIIIVWLTFGYIYQWGNNPINKIGYIILLVFFGALLSGFYGMTIIVTDIRIKIKFGIGLYTKKIDLATLSSVKIEKYPVFYGYGIRMLPDGILYNVNGRYAVRIRFKDKKNVILIGTNDWDNLRDAIEGSIVKK